MTPESFRAEARAWLAEHAPAKGGPDDFSGAHLLGALSIDAFHEHERWLYATVKAWQRTLVDAGWAGLSWPVEYGGRGLPDWTEQVFGEEHARTGASTKAVSVGLQMISSALLQHGSDAQKQAWLPATLRCDLVWCQLFSEPDAGSDLRSVTTRATPTDGGGFVVDGQKVWTSGAAESQLGLALVRAPAGLTCVVVDMQSPGVRVVPLREMAGGFHFNEVFLDGVVVPARHVVGEPGDGWTVARTVLGSERAAIGGGTSARVWRALADTAEKRGVAKDPLVRQQIALAYTRERLLELYPSKLHYSEHARRTASVGVEITAGDDPAWLDRLYFACGLRIGGGTDEIQRNVLAERVLGLPRDPR